MPRTSRSLLLTLLLTAIAVPLARARRLPFFHQPRPTPHPLVVGYFPQWGVDTGYFPKNLLTNGGAAALDQINYAQGFVSGGRCSVANPGIDLNLPFTAETSVSGVADSPSNPFRGDLHQLAELKQRFPHLKVLISLEGQATDFANDALPANRHAFVTSCIDTFLRGHLAPGIEAGSLFDGIDVDWEYPEEQNAADYQALLEEFRRQMDALRPHLRLSVAVGPSPRMYPGVDMAAVSRVVDQVGLMNYDYNGPWQHSTGFIAPLLSEDPGSTHGGTVEHTVLAYIAAGVPPHKLLLGLPFYGYGWHHVPSTANGLHQPGQAIHGDRPYSYLQTLIAGTSPSAPREASPPPPTDAPPSTTPPQPRSTPAPPIKPFTLFREPHSQAPWLFNGDTFWTFEDPTSIRFKVAFAHQQSLGGVMIWELGEDSSEATLLKAIHQPPTR